ncbi:MAG: hypothetical protein J5623_03110 [Clostridiales bacterium]|nr:hypothetical protein [Clostridiales bacterium]
MFGLKKEIYCGKEDEAFRKKTAKLAEKGIKYEIDRPVSHAADLGRGAGVGRYGENNAPSVVRILVKKKDYDEAVRALREE